MYHSVKWGGMVYHFPQLWTVILVDTKMLSGGTNVSIFTSFPTPTLHRGGGFEILGTGCQNFSGMKQAIEWTKNTTSGRETYSDRDPLLKRRPELIMPAVPSIKGAGSSLAFR